MPPSRPAVVAAVAISRHADAATSFEEAFRDARSRLTASPAFAIVATTHDLSAAPGFADAMARDLGETPCLGTSTQGLALDGVRFDGDATAVMLVAGALSARHFAIAIPPLVPALPVLGDAVAALGGEADAILMFADPRTALVPVLPRLASRFAPGSRVVGGGSTARGAELFQIAGTRVLTKACAGLAIRFEGGVSREFVSQGGDLVGLTGTVTNANGGVVLEVDGKPATVLLEALRTAGLPVRPDEAAALFACALAPGGVQALSKGAFMVRNLTGIDTAAKAVSVAANIPEGWGIGIVLREAIGSRSRVIAAAKGVAAALAGATPVAGLYFDCTSRGEGIYGAEGVDETQIHKAIGAFPLLSLKSSFEFGPLNVGGADRPELHLYSGVLWVAGSHMLPDVIGIS